MPASIDIAKEAGNYKQFHSFYSNLSSRDDHELWAIFYTHHRESSLLELANHKVIEKIIEPFCVGVDEDAEGHEIYPDCEAITHRHWAVGWIAGYQIRIFRDSSKTEKTEAAMAYEKILQRLENYPILDENLYSDMEYEATLENIQRLCKEMATEGWQLGDIEDATQRAYNWLSEHNPNSLENNGDQGGHPSEDDLIEAFIGLEFPFQD